MQQLKTPPKNDSLGGVFYLEYEILIHNMSLAIHAHASASASA